MTGNARKVFSHSYHASPAFSESLTLNAYNRRKMTSEMMGTDRNHIASSGFLNNNTMSSRVTVTETRITRGEINGSSNRYETHTGMRIKTARQKSSSGEKNFLSIAEAKQ